MDLRAKQRLTGAVILVALFVLLVPPLLNGPREAQTPAEASDAGLRQYTIDIDEQNRRAQPNGSPAGEPQAALPAPAPAPDSTLALPGEAAAPAPTPAPATPVTATAPAPNKTAPAAESVPAPRAEPPRPAATQHSERGTFVVQLGTFSSRENAERLTRDMTAKGFAAFVVPTTNNGRELYRVRVGPTRDRASAEALAAQLKRVGQSGSIVPIT